MMALLHDIHMTDINMTLMADMPTVLQESSFFEREDVTKAIHPFCQLVSLNITGISVANCSK